MLNVGDTLGGIYEITEKIGSGGGGIIFKANHLRMKKTVAIKLIKDNVKNILENRAEVDLLKNLKNDYLPQVLDFVEDNNDVYTVMEFIEGENFKQLISAGKTYDKKSVQKYAVQLCEAVEYLHSQNPPIIHSDIKPANIMLTPNDRICLIDFNISSVSDGAGAYSVGGSAGYAAPEQFKKIIEVPVEVDEFREETRFIDEEDDPTEILDANDNSDVSVNSNTSPSSVIVKNETKKVGKAYIDTRTDIYGIGASLHYIITGRRPVDGKTDFRGIKVSKKMQRIISKAMAPDPNHRYKSVSEMKKDIENNGTLKINLKAAIAASVAVVLIAAAAIIYPIVHIDMKTSATAISYGNEFIIEKTSTKTVCSAKVSNKYNATAVSAMKALYDYYSSLNYYERAKYLRTSNAAMEVIEETKLEHPDKDIQAVTPTSSAIYSAKLDPENGEACKYICEHFTNYTGEDELYIGCTFGDGKIETVFVSDVPDAFDVITANGTLDGNIGAAITTAVNDIGLSLDESGSIRMEVYDLFGAYEHIISELDSVWGSVPGEERIEILGLSRSISTEELYFGSENLYGEDLSPLAQFTNLKKLDFSSADGVDISAFPELPTVEELDFGSSDITSLEGIANKFPNLKTLDLHNTYISDLSPLSDLGSLENLDCHECESLEDVSPFGKINSLKTLYLHHCKSISDISAFSSLTKLENLSLGSCKLIRSISAVSNISSLETLNISSLVFEDISFTEDISKLKNLKSLDMSSVGYINGTYSDGSDKTENLKDISCLKNLTKLEELTINTSIPDISPLAGMTEMKILYLNASKIEDFSPIKNMTKLEKLNINPSYEFDPSVFEKLTNIKELNINIYSKYVDGESKYAYVDSTELLKYISKMKSLENLTLYHVMFSASDVDTICGLNTLSSLSLTTNISAADSKKIEKALKDKNEDCSVYINIDEFEVWGKGEAVATETETEKEDDLEYPVFDDDLEEPDPMPVDEDDGYIDDIYLDFFSGLKGEITLSETTGNKDIDEFAKLMPNKIYFPGNLPLSEKYESGIVEDENGTKVCDVFYDQYYNETESGAIEASTEHIAYKYSLVEKGYHIKRDPEAAGHELVYSDNGELVAVVINCGDCFCISFQKNV